MSAESNIKLLSLLSHGISLSINVQTFESPLDRGAVSRKPRKLFGPVKPLQDFELCVTELFYSHILKMNRGSLHTITFKRIHIPVLIKIQMILKWPYGPGNFPGLSINRPLKSSDLSYSDVRTISLEEFIICQYKTKNKVNKAMTPNGSTRKLSDNILDCYFDFI